MNFASGRIHELENRKMMYLLNLTEAIFKGDTLNLFQGLPFGFLTVFDSNDFHFSLLQTETISHLLVH